MSRETDEKIRGLESDVSGIRDRVASTEKMIRQSECQPHQAFDHIKDLNGKYYRLHGQVQTHEYAINAVAFDKKIRVMEKLIGKLLEAAQKQNTSQKDLPVSAGTPANEIQDMLDELAPPPVVFPAYLGGLEFLVEYGLVEIKYENESTRLNSRQVRVMLRILDAALQQIDHGE